ncbi:adenylosuccinate synthetase [Candidatus Kaiserbacteria bacterium]|nr:adenylosuccinate synthetase [Candidatus Kaiserbacteria bacterium]
MTQAHIVVDLGFGDSGKGTIVDYLARTTGAQTVVRFNGGAQAAHNVVTPDGRHHTFAQFGSGTFVPGVHTHLSRFMLLDPYALVPEAAHLAALGCGNVFARLSVDADALVVTPYHKAGNRLREHARGSGLHGSCGMGIGEAMVDSIAFPNTAIRARDLRDPAVLAQKLALQRARKIDEFGATHADDVLDPVLAAQMRLLADASAVDRVACDLWRIAQRFRIVPASYLAVLARSGLLFEGAQGVLLDEWYGFHPYTTWSTTTFENALALLAEAGVRSGIRKIGVVRSYATRHGAGPFPTQDALVGSHTAEPHNGTGRWQGAFRKGWFDLVLLRYAQQVSGGADEIALTHVDAATTLPLKVAVAYRAPAGGINPRIGIVADGVLTSLHQKALLTDLAAQERLTAFLQTARPVYAHVTDAADLIRHIEQSTAPVTLLSHGPKATDKRLRSLLSIAA